MTKQVKPLLSCDIDLDKVQFPVYASKKLDGIRCLIIDGVAYSRSLKPIRNKYIQSVIGKHEYNGFDGELVVGNIYDKDVFQKTTSGVMSENGTPDFKYWVFDDFTNPSLDYTERLSELYKRYPSGKDSTWLLTQELVTNKSQIESLLEREKEFGGEGLILRNPNGRYKYGRSTAKEQLSMKLKFFCQDEFKVIGFNERMHNANEATTNELGYTERSNHKENMIPMNTLGSLILKYGDDTFNLGTGFDDALRKEIWDNKEKYLGKLASVRYMSVGQKTLPRVPSFIGWRDNDDIS